MTSGWIVLSTQWDFSSVQASLNVIISVLGTIGLWAFTRFWWQRVSLNVLRSEDGVPLSRIFIISSLGESWDVVATLGRQIFAKGNLHLLAQLIVVIGVTVACALAGPIAKTSLKEGLTIVEKELHVLESVKGGGGFGNLLYADVLWNDTAQSLDDAAFPDNQLLEFLPPTITPPWTYVAEEWDPTWKAACNYTDNVILYNMTGSGVHNVFDPVDAFPAYRETYDATWLNSTEFRVSSDYNSWQDWTQTNQFQEALFYVLIQSDPEVDDRMLHNNETLYLSISVLHAQNFRVLYDDTSGVRGELTWRPIGSVGNASYSRAECVITRKSRVNDEYKVPWPWTNDTTSIVSGYRTYHNGPFARAAVHDQPVKPPSARDLFRFYQVYMASINTFHSTPSPRKLSAYVQTVEISLVFLVALVFLFGLTGWITTRYMLFLKRNKEKIGELYVPDGKIEWMIHAAKRSKMEDDLEAGGEKNTQKDSEHFCTARFGLASPDFGSSDAGLPVPRLARVKTYRNSISDVSSRRRNPSSSIESARFPSSIEKNHRDQAHSRRSLLSSAGSNEKVFTEGARNSVCHDSASPERPPSAHIDNGMLQCNANSHASQTDLPLRTPAPADSNIVVPEEDRAGCSKCHNTEQHEEAPSEDANTTTLPSEEKYSPVTREHHVLVH